MNLKTIGLAGLLTFGICVDTPAELRPQPQMEFSKGTAGSFTTEWDGVSERTYFFQWSTDLVTWEYSPFMAFGLPETEKHTFGGISNSDKFFTRLKYTDIPTADAELADYDLDGLGNLEELSIGTDPLDADTDHDGISDGVEIANGGDPLSNEDGDALLALDSDGDGISDARELAMGTSPTLRDSDGDGYDDNVDDFPLDPDRHEAAPDPNDTTGPLVTLDSPSNATTITGP